jgi:hypothetical protein
VQSGNVGFLGWAASDDWGGLVAWSPQSVPMALIRSIQPWKGIGAAAPGRLACPLSGWSPAMRSSTISGDGGLVPPVRLLAAQHLR